MVEHFFLVTFFLQAKCNYAIMHCAFVSCGSCAGENFGIKRLRGKVRMQMRECLLISKTLGDTFDFVFSSKKGFGFPGFGFPLKWITCEEFVLLTAPLLMFLQQFILLRLLCSLVIVPHQLDCIYICLYLFAGPYLFPCHSSTVPLDCIFMSQCVLWLQLFSRT